MNEEFVIPSLIPDYLFWSAVIVVVITLFIGASKLVQPGRRSSDPL